MRQKIVLLGGEMPFTVQVIGPLKTNLTKEEKRIMKVQEKDMRKRIFNSYYSSLIAVLFVVFLFIVTLPFIPNKETKLKIAVLETFIGFFSGKYFSSWLIAKSRNGR